MKLDQSSQPITIDNEQQLSDLMNNTAQTSEQKDKRTNRNNSDVSNNSIDLQDNSEKSQI